MLWKCPVQYASKFGKLSSGHKTGKGHFSFQSQRKTISKNIQTTSQLHSSHILAKWCSEFSKPGFTSMWTVKLQMFKLNLEKSEEPGSNYQRPLDHQKNKSSRKTSASALLTMPKPLTVWVTANRGKFLKRWAYQTIWPASWELWMQVKKQQLEVDMEQHTGSR